MYLTYKEYSNLGFDKVAEDNFQKLETVAERHINLATRDYYVLHPLQDDLDSYRVNKFKLAMAIQIDYLSTLGGNLTLSETLDNSPTSVSVGRMRIEANQASKSATVGRTMFSTEAYMELMYTGLLYKGVDYR